MFSSGGDFLGLGTVLSWEGRVNWGEFVLSGIG